MKRPAHRLAYSLLVALSALGACKSNSPPITRTPGQTAYLSSPFPGGGNSFGKDGDATAGASTPAANAEVPAQNTTRTVQETDLYRLDGNRLYYLNSYRGLMVFDVTNVDQPKLLGRSPIFGDPVDMLVQNGIAIVIVGDWYGQLDDGTPFHGSIVRGLDATDPTNIKNIGDAKLGGWIQDTRVVGNVLYAVSQDWGWEYGWGYNGVSTPTIVISSVNFANNVISAVSSKSYAGYSGIFNVTPNSIMLAHSVEPTDPNAPAGPAQTQLLYLDISDPNGAIVERGTLTVDGAADGWGADNGRWNLDFADGLFAHVVGCAGSQGYCDGTSGYILSTVDFTNPDAPVLKSSLTIPTPGWSVAARFDTNLLYLSPDSNYGDGSSTPFQVYDTTDPKAPFLAGTVTIPGTVWNILPAPGQRIFALGSDWTNPQGGDSVSLKYIDVTNPAAPALLGTSTFGQGWAWTPAADTFKAFTLDATKGLVVLPFSGWDDQNLSYNNGLQLIQFTAQGETTAGAGHTKGWVERGIFVGNRLVSLSDLALAVVDYSNPNAPAVTAELTLARNVVASQPGGATIAEVSSDWWGNDVSSSEVRVLPIANAAETSDGSGALSATVPGVGAQVFNNGSFSYVVTNVQTQGPCPNDPNSTCALRAEQIQVADLSNGGLALRGTVQLPADTWGWYGWGWWGFWWYDWFNGAEAVQVGPDVLAFRRWEPVYDGNGYYLDSNSLLYVVDLSNPDAPQIASVTITSDPQGWWGNMHVVGTTLYTSHYEWYQQPGQNNQGTVQYYVDRIDLSNRAQPVVETKVNVPGLLVGGSDADPSVLYFMDYHWDYGGNFARNDFNVCRLDGNGQCELQSNTQLDGWVGQTFVQSEKVYVSTQLYQYNGNGPQVELHAIDVTDPTQPIDRVASGPRGWGWLLGLAGDRLLVSSGWGWDGVDIYQLVDGQPPAWKQFVRTLGWWVNGASRQDNSLYLSSGYWGVQEIDLK